MSGLDPRGEAIAAQRRAADPAVSAWVGASAGSGKTTLLTNRVLRLLLGGCEPGRILCLTYTRAAAAEMATRLGTRLGEWASLNDADLAKALDALGVVPDAETMARARGLFARVLDQPGGLRIATIHAFCQSLLRRFPLEAAVAPHFALIEERDQAELLAAARDQALGEQTAGVADALETVAPLVDDSRFASLVSGVLGARGRVSRALAAEHGVADMQRRALDLDEGETEESVLAAACARDMTPLSRAAAAQALGSQEDLDRAVPMKEWLALGTSERVVRWTLWRDVFLKRDGDIQKRLATKKAIAAMADIVAVMDAEARFVEDTEAKLRAARAARASAALMRLVGPVITSYTRRKHIRAGLDYEDLITCARTLLGNTNTAWVQYKLDGGLDHVLLDEAQDTSPAQWDVVEKLTAEFFAGLGARDDVTRTLFAVGDVKQSIYRFQGAAPALFGAAREKAAARVTAMHGPSHFRAEQLAVSFRSTAPVLALVDAVFADEAAAKGVALDGGAIAHRPARTGQAGSVTLWPLIHPDPNPEDTTWDPTPSERSRKGGEKLAEAIAAQIEHWLDTKELLPARGRAMKAGDILVLVRHRGTFVGQLVRALKHRGVAVSGIDRMKLVDELAVMDVMATLDALLLPEDDLTFACALRSPIFGISDASLMDLAVGRGRRSLRDTLRRRAAEREDWRAAEALFAALAARADFDTPQALIARLLGPLGARARLLARLGPDAADPLDELLNTALAHEHAHPPNLQGFLAWLRAGAAEIKREQEAGANAVRVMTVHGAKGLESPVVILADSTAIPGPIAPLVWVKDAASGDDVPLWSPRNEFKATPIAEARAVETEAEREEYRRLLYVAMTRAEDRLVITGALSRQGSGKHAGCWYDLVEAGFQRLAAAGAAPITFDPGALLGETWASGGWHLATAQAPGAERRREPEGAAAAARAVVPDWARAAPPGEETPPRPLAPSREEGEDPPAASPRGKARSEARFRRGTLVHALLQHLPALPPERRGAAARSWLAAPGQGLGAEEVEEIAAETLAIIEGERFAALFAPDALAEAPIAGRVGARIVAGQVDRLAITDTAVLVADFKTNRPPPERVEDVAPVYLRQMAAYRAVLLQVFPGRTVTCALIWTYAARMMELPDALLDAHDPAPM